MKKGLFIIALLLTNFAFSQIEDAAKKADSVEFDRQFLIYQLSKKYNDFSMAKNALYNMLSIAPNNFAILDSIVMIYYDFQQYTSAALISQDIVQIKPDDMLATEIAAISFDNLGVKNRALPYYEKLYLDRNDMNILYRMAFLQYELKRYNEANASVDILIETDETKEMQILFPINQEKNQQVSLLAAGYRLKGMIAQDQGNTEEAKKFFNQALTAAPDFVIVKQQLEKLN